ARRERPPVHERRGAGGAADDALRRWRARCRDPGATSRRNDERRDAALARDLGGDRGAALPSRTHQMNVAFLHPGLRLGRAARLIVDAASYLVAHGHRVVVLTAHHDRGRAFPATIDGTLDVRVHGGALPAQVFGRLRAPCAIARMSWLALRLARLRPRPDV